jgi:hypothetical protein
MPKMEEEIWKAIPGNLGYEVSNLGRVRSLKRKTPRILKPCYYRGYLQVHLSNGKKGDISQRRIHNLVMLAFVGPRPEGLEVCHEDDNPANNRLDNLRYDTHLANMQDAVKQGRMIRKLSREQKTQITKDRANGLSARGIAKKYKVSDTTIYRIYSTRDTRYDRAKAIREEYARGNIYLIDIGRKYGLTLSGVGLIVRGKRCLEAGGPIKGIDY